MRLPIDEDHPLNGMTIYGAAKVANEQMARAFAHLSDLPTTALRYFNVYGARQDIRSKYVEVMIRWLDLIDEGKPLVLFGDGSSSADFVYVSDVVDANMLAAESDATNAIVNVCTGLETSMRALAELLLEVTGSDVGVEYRPQPAGALPARRFGDPTRAERILGFKAKTSLRDGVRRLVDWRRYALATARASEATA